MDQSYVHSAELSPLLPSPVPGIYSLSHSRNISVSIVIMPGILLWFPIPFLVKTVVGQLIKCWLKFNNSNRITEQIHNSSRNYSPILSFPKCQLNNSYLNNLLIEQFGNWTFHNSTYCLCTILRCHLSKLPTQQLFHWQTYNWTTVIEP